MTATQCYICEDEIDPKEDKFASDFEGKRHPVCHVCAKGILDGTAILQQHGVTPPPENTNQNRK